MATKAKKAGKGIRLFEQAGMNRADIARFFGLSNPSQLKDDMEITPAMMQSLIGYCKKAWKEEKAPPKKPSGKGIATDELREITDILGL